MNILMTKLILGCALLLCLCHRGISLHHFIISLLITSSLDIQFLMEPMSFLEPKLSQPGETDPVWGRSMPDGQENHITTTAESQHPVLFTTALIMKWSWF